MDEARSSRESGQEKVQEIDAQLLKVQDVIKVLPGQAIAADGVVESMGGGYVDNALITGESLPVYRGYGEAVFSGTVNMQQTLYIRVTAVGKNSTVAQIVALVQQAQLNKAPIQDYADKVAGIFAPVIILLALLTFVVWRSLCATNALPPHWYRAEYRSCGYFAAMFAISVVVISCPCALGLATPLAMIVGSNVAAHYGLLIKGGKPFELVHRYARLPHYCCLGVHGRCVG